MGITMKALIGLGDRFYNCIHLRKEHPAEKPCPDCELAYVPAAELTVLVAREQKAFSLLALYGVPKERARSVSNGIGVLATRLAKEIECALGELQRYEDTPPTFAELYNAHDDAKTLQAEVDTLRAALEEIIKCAGHASRDADRSDHFRTVSNCWDGAAKIATTALAVKPAL